MGNPYVITGEDGSSDVADWGPTRTYYFVPSASGPSVTLNKIVFSMSTGTWPGYLASYVPIFTYSVSLVAAAFDSTGLLGPTPLYSMHSGSPAAQTVMWQGAALGHPNPLLDIWDTCDGTGDGQRIVDFSNVGGFRAESGHYMVVQMLPAVGTGGGGGDGEGDLWLYDAFRATFYLEE